MKILVLIITASLGITGARVGAQESKGDSYLSKPMRKNIIFEGQIAPDYEVYQFGKDPKKMRKGFSLQVIATPKILLEIYQSKSRPVKTPSYMPQVTFLGTWKTRSLYVYPFLTIAHHSNGQSGKTLENAQSSVPADTTIDTGENASHVNTTDGNFMTNYIKIGYAVSLARFKNHKLGVAYEHHPLKGWWFQIDESLKDIYGRKRLHLYYEYDSKNIQVDAEYTKIYDEWALPEGVSSRILDITARFRVPGFKNMAWLFANMYQGQNYYNIHFNKQLRQFKMGLSVKTKLIGF